MLAIYSAFCAIICVSTIKVKTLFGNTFVTGELELPHAIRLDVQDACVSVEFKLSNGKVDQCV